jgi:simple sugar transport system permease protein
MCVGTACGCVAEAKLFDLLGGARGLANVPFLAILVPIIATLLGGALMGLIFSFLTVTLKANQNVTGLAMTTLGVGISDFMIASVDGYKFTTGAKFFRASLPFADKMGWFGKLFFSYGIMFYLAIAVAIVTALVLNKTKIGLHLRAVGENPATADAAGINVTGYKYLATCIGSAIAGLGGLQYVMSYADGVWSNNAFGDRGWMAIALVIFALWRPHMTIIGSTVFGLLFSCSSYITNISWINVTMATKPLLKMLPYLFTILVLIFTSIRKKREDQPPQSLGLAYFREER